jgi:tRNA threonylcarbamoyladenosine biosynthesis protein TsaE
MPLSVEAHEPHSMQPDIPEIELALRDEAATAALAAVVAPHVRPGFVLYLSGDLGSGKTAFTRALLRALGHGGRVRSPTFTLAEPYNLSNFELYHFDFYRFSTEGEWRDAGFDEILGGEAAAVIEWPELAGSSLPAPDLWLRLAPGDEPQLHACERVVHLSAGTEWGSACLSGIVVALRAGLLAGVSLRGGSPQDSP